MICFYSTFLLFSAMQADPDNAEGHESCNLFHRERNGLSLWIGFFITFASLFYAALRSDMMAILGKDPKWMEDEEDMDENEMDSADGKVRSLLTKNDKKAAIAMNDVEDIEDRSNYDDVDDDLRKKKKNIFDEEKEATQEQLDQKANIYFHAVMMLAACYMSMLFTNWGTNKQSIDTTGTISFIVESPPAGLHSSCFGGLYAHHDY